jgi:hypothetical protein
MQAEPKAPDSGRYEDDFYEWTIAQAAAVRDGRWADIDVENLAEEIDSLGISTVREIRSRLRVMIARLLKQKIQPERATRSWENTIYTQATEIEDVLLDAPSLRRRLPEFAEREYPRARRMASGETRLSLRRFPEKMTPDIEERLNAVLAEAAATD